MNIRGRNKVNAEFNMSSMTDIVFLLLIFFMIAVTTMTNTNALDLVLPNSSFPCTPRVFRICAPLETESRFGFDAF